ncbi:MAG TPA: hypothetical protein VI248_01885 [Kineosporiaceae bacterium]
MDQAIPGERRTFDEPAPRPRRSPDDDPSPDDPSPDAGVPSPDAGARRPPSVERLRARYVEAAGTQPGPERVARWERLVGEAVGCGHHGLAIEARRRLSADHCRAGRWDLAFPLLSASLASYDEHAHDLGPDVDDLLRAWAARLLPVLAEFAQASLAQVERAFDDFAVRWAAGADGRRMLYQARLRVAPVTGDWSAEERYHELWLAVGGPRPGHADDVELAIRRLVLRGDPVSVARGLELAEPVLSGRDPLDRPLLGITCLLALPLARAGALHLARALADTAHRKLTQQDVRAEVAGTLIEFCALTGDLPSAVDLAERRLWVFDGLHRPYGVLEFATATAVLARRMIDEGHRGHVLGAGPLAITAEDLHRRAGEVALRLAAQFDVRNGNDHHGTRVRARLAADPLPVPRRRELRPAEGGLVTSVLAGSDGSGSTPVAPAGPGAGAMGRAGGMPGEEPDPAAGLDPARPMRRPADPVKLRRAEPDRASVVSRWWRRGPRRPGPGAS